MILATFSNKPFSSNLLYIAGSLVFHSVGDCKDEGTKQKMSFKLGVLEDFYQMERFRSHSGPTRCSVDFCGTEVEDTETSSGKDVAVRGVYGTDSVF